ncbi:MAG: hypothetical protein RBS68_04110 [Anaerolineales bacterium]|nr:hypothetical protein [Anaerolineales bacterium]
MRLPKVMFIFFALVLTLQAAPMRVSAKPFMPQTPSASVGLTAPVPASGQVGDAVGFGLVFTVAGLAPGVAGAEVYVSYNPLVVAPLGTPQVTVEVLPDFFGSPNVNINEILPAAQCPGGTLPCIHLVLAGSPQTTQSGLGARFHFTSVAQGQACFSILQSNLVDADGFAVSHTRGGEQCATFQTDVDLTGAALRQGVPANPNVGAGTLSCTNVTATGLVEAPQTVVSDAGGAFAFIDIPLDTYVVRASYPGYLAADKAGVIVDGSQDEIALGTVSLRGGDVNGDNVINILDIGQIVSKFGQTGVAVKSAAAGCGPADDPADINDDGVINISDLAIVAGNWGLVGPTLWP